MARDADSNRDAADALSRMTGGTSRAPSSSAPTGAKPASGKSARAATAPTAAANAGSETARPSMPTVSATPSTTARPIAKQVSASAASPATPGPARRASFSQDTAGPGMLVRAAQNTGLKQTLLPPCLTLAVTLPLLAVGYWLVLDEDAVARNAGHALPIGLCVLGAVFALTTWRLRTELRK